MKRPCLFPLPGRDPWLPVGGGVSCGGAAGPAEGSDGKSDDGTHRGTRGVQSAPFLPQHRGDLQPARPGPGRAAAEAGGDQRE